MRLFVILAGLLVWPAVAGADPVFGRWVVEDGRAVVEIAPCGAQACGRLVWMQEPWGPDGRPKRDVNNPDPAARSRLLCGMPLVTGLQPAGDGAWKGGQIYSARDGKSFGFQIAPDGPNRLTARGFMGIALLGKSQTWVRDDGQRGTCTTLNSPGSNR